MSAKTSILVYGSRNRKHMIGEHSHLCTSVYQSVLREQIRGMEINFGQGRLTLVKAALGSFSLYFFFSLFRALRGVSGGGSYWTRMHCGLERLGVFMGKRGGLKGGDEGSDRNWIREPKGRECGELEGFLKRLQDRRNLNAEDKVEWNLDASKEFSVKDLRDLLEEVKESLGGNRRETIWCSMVLKKINIFAWRGDLGHDVYIPRFDHFPKMWGIG
ncbi:hypothetical protein OSB04_027152 [Centaurea solstitialis]|uniref:Uncharacterized protein n=1 Tax=Centaurea solstitialis TaxID=347529 RepID=A0AA38SRI6_9ASTR|nr:hypothetical protein OSB04_027152 [Centaurea solstitialis]